jgi:hypothetical protein
VKFGRFHRSNFTLRAQDISKSKARPGGASWWLTSGSFCAGTPPDRHDDR